MPDGNHLVAFDTVLAILVALLASFRVSQMRVKHGIHGPVMTGHPDFERACRAHANTVENMILFVPALWMAAFFFGGQIPFWIGLAWIVGRIMYIVGYGQNDTRVRGPGAGLSYLALIGLLIVAGLGLFGVQIQL